MPSNQRYKTEAEVDAAYSEALRGGAVGAAKWGAVAGLAAATGYALSPIYRGLTVQFKVYAPPPTVYTLLHMELGEYKS
jgi:hypothetical protein